jgi:hypothetical protein
MVASMDRTKDYKSGTDMQIEALRIQANEVGSYTTKYYYCLL